MTEIIIWDLYIIVIHYIHTSKYMITSKCWICVCRVLSFELFIIIICCWLLLLLFDITIAYIHLTLMICVFRMGYHYHIRFGSKTEQIVNRLGRFIRIYFFFTKYFNRIYKYIWMGLFIGLKIANETRKNS